MKETGAPKLLPKRGQGIRWSSFFMTGRGAVLRDCFLLCLAGFLLSALHVAGQPVPLAACLAAALPLGLPSVFAAAGAVGGYLLFTDGSAAAELVALSILMLASAAVFQGTELPARKWFFPAIAGSVSAVLGAVFFLSAPGLAGLRVWLMKTVFAAAATLGFRAAAFGDKRGKLFFTAAILAGLAGIPSPIDLGILCAAMLTVCVPELAAVTVFGIALDLTGSYVNCAAAALLLPAVAWRILKIRGKALRAATGALLTGAVVLFCGAGEPAQLFGIAIGYFLGAVLAGTGLPHIQLAASAKESASHSLGEAAEVLEALREQVRMGTQEQPAQSEADSVYDGAADRVCRCCARFHRCWEHSAEQTYFALTGAAKRIIERGVAEPEDFPETFRDNCCHMEGFLTAINQELEGMLYRRRYRMQMREAQQVVSREFSCVADYLRDMQEQLHEPPRGKGAYFPVVGVSTARKRGNLANGDRGVCFAGPNTDYYVLLCDGMGSGREAAALSSETVHFLKKLLYSGMQPEDALEVLNGAFLLRGTGCFATVDLLCVDLERGEAELFKWGGAPSYLRQNEAAVKKMGTAALPPGVGVGGDHTPERYKLSLSHGEMLILLSDGAGGEETEGAIAGFTGDSPRELAALLIAGASAMDDMTAVVLSLRPLSSCA